MQLSDDTLNEFIGIWREEFQEEISIEQARIRATELVELYSLVYRQTPGELNEGRAMNPAVTEIPTAFLAKRVRTIPAAPPRTTNDILKPQPPVE